MKAFILVFGLLLIGCATSPEKIPAQYVSPIQYKDYSCDQLAGEMERVSRRSSELHGNLKKTADGDSAQMGIGMVLFWPTLFFLDGDGPQAQEYARLKGEFEAMEKSAIQKDCGLPVRQVQNEPTPVSAPNGAAGIENK